MAVWFDGSIRSIKVFAGDCRALLTSHLDPARMRTALVHDWLDTWRGGENVLEALVGLFPQADLFAVVDFLPEELRGADRRQAGDDDVHPAAAVCPNPVPHTTCR